MLIKFVKRTADPFRGAPSARVEAPAFRQFLGNELGERFYVRFV